MVHILDGLLITVCSRGHTQSIRLYQHHTTHNVIQNVMGIAACRWIGKLAKEGLNYPFYF